MRDYTGHMCNVEWPRIALNFVNYLRLRVILVWVMRALLCHEDLL